MVSTTSTFLNLIEKDLSNYSIQDQITSYKEGQWKHSFSSFAIQACTDKKPLCDRDCVDLDTLLSFTTKTCSVLDYIVAIIQSLQGAHTFFNTLSALVSGLSLLSGLIGIVSLIAAGKGLYQDEQAIRLLCEKEKELTNPQELEILSQLKTRLQWNQVSRLLMITATVVGMVGLCLLIWCPPLAAAAWALYAASSGLLLIQVGLDEVVDHNFCQKLDSLKAI